MKIPKWIYDNFKGFDRDENGIISQSEIDIHKGSGTIFDTSSFKIFEVRDGMDISLFIKENRAFFEAAIQYTDNEYSKGRKILKDGKFVPTEEKRKTCEDDAKSIQVEQGEFAVKTYSEETPSIQTYNVCSCVTVIIYDRNNKRGLMAHIDNADRAHSLKEVLLKYNFNPETSEVHIIGGHTDLSEGVVEIIDETVKSFNLKVTEYDVLGSGVRREVQLDLNTGEVYDYTESKPTYVTVYDKRKKNRSLVPNEKSDK